MKHQWWNLEQLSIIKDINISAMTCMNAYSKLIMKDYEKPHIGCS